MHMLSLDVDRSLSVFSGIWCIMSICKLDISVCFFGKVSNDILKHLYAIDQLAPLWSSNVCNVCVCVRMCVYIYNFHLINKFYIHINSQFLQLILSSNYFFVCHIHYDRQTYTKFQYTHKYMYIYIISYSHIYCMPLNLSPQCL